MKKFSDLKIGDYYYRLVVGDDGEISVDKHDITEIHDNYNSYNKRLASCKTFESVHKYKTKNTTGTSMDSMDIQFSDLDKSYAVDGRGYEDIVYISDEECLSEAKILLLKKTIELDKEHFRKLDKEHSELLNKIFLMDNKLRRMENPDKIDMLIDESHSLTPDIIDKIMEEIKKYKTVS